MRTRLVTIAALVACCCAPSVAFAQAPTEKGRLGIPLTEITKSWTGDLDGMGERRLIRVLTTYSKTQYFIDRGTRSGGLPRAIVPGQIDPIQRSALMLGSNVYAPPRVRISRGMSRSRTDPLVVTISNQLPSSWFAPASGSFDPVMTGS
jgi:hypothetical protein